MQYQLFILFVYIFTYNNSFLIEKPDFSTKQKTVEDRSHEYIVKSNHGYNRGSPKFNENEGRHFHTKQKTVEDRSHEYIVKSNHGYNRGSPKFKENEGRNFQTEYLKNEKENTDNYGAHEDQKKRYDDVIHINDDKPIKPNTLSLKYFPDVYHHRNNYWNNNPHSDYKNSISPILDEKVGYFDKNSIISDTYPKNNDDLQKDVTKEYLIPTGTNDIRKTYDDLKNEKEIEENYGGHDGYLVKDQKKRYEGVTQINDHKRIEPDTSSSKYLPDFHHRNNYWNNYPHTNYRSSKYYNSPKLDEKVSNSYKNFIVNDNLKNFVNHKYDATKGYLSPVLSKGTKTIYDDENIWISLKDIYNLIADLASVSTHY